MAVCLSCGAPLRDGARFCTECGARQEAQPVIPLSAPTAPVMDAIPETPAFPEAPAFPESIEPAEPPVEATAAMEEEPADAPFAQPAFDPAFLQAEEPASNPDPVMQEEAAPFSPVPPMAVPAAPVIPAYPPEPQAKSRVIDPERPGKKSKYAPMSSLGVALQLVLMSIPVVGFILMILWSCGVCRKLARRNLARGYLILFIVALVALIIGALLVRFVFADAFTGLFENLFPGYTIQWG